MVFVIFSFVLFTALVALITFLKTRGDNLDTNDGYFLGGRSLTAPIIAGSLLLTNLSASSFVGMAANGYTSNMSVMGYEVCSGVVLVIVAMFLLPRYLKQGITTIPEFIEARYDHGTKTFVTCLFLVSYFVNMLPVTLYSGAIAMEQLFGIEEIFGISHITAVWIMVVLIGVIGSIYAVSGGLKAVAVSDTLNGIALVIGGLLIPVFAIIFLGHGSFAEGFNTLGSSSPEKWNAIGSAKNGDPVPFTTLFTGLFLVNLYYWGTDQSIIQRGLGAKNLAEGQKGVVWAGFLKVLTPFIVIVPGVIAYYIYGGGLTAQQADMIYPQLVADVLPKPLLGFFAAAMMGAILSTFNSVLNSASTLFALDIYKGTKKGQSMNDEMLVATGRKFGIAVAVVSIIIAPFIAYAPNGLFDYLQQINGFFNVPIFTIVFLGYITKKVPAKAAKIGLAYFVPMYGAFQLADKLSSTGRAVLSILVLVAIIAAIVLKGKKELRIKAIVLTLIYFAVTIIFLSLAWKFNLHFFHVSAVLFVFTSILMKTLGKWEPMDRPFELGSNNLVNVTPWKGRVKTSAFVLYCMVAMYFIFSPLGVAKEGGADITTVISLIVLAAVTFILAIFVDKKVQIADAKAMAAIKSSR
ncbi:MAG: solute:sodium symporter family transporter [Sphaerochaeta sp.]